MVDKQVDNNHYWTEDYLCPERFLHYREQFVTIFRINPGSVLEVGPGPGLLPVMLRRFCRDVKTLDFADDTGADFVSDIKCMPLDDSSYDLVCAFQVLEHIPLDDIGRALKEMSRVSGRYVLFSVPNNNLMHKIIFLFKLRLLGRSITYIYKKKRYVGVSNNKEHYWEIGVDGVSVNSIDEVSENCNLNIVKTWINGVDQYFLYEKKR